MTTITEARLDLEIADWNLALQGKTIRGVRPTHDDGPVPKVVLLFADGSQATISVLDEVFFEAAMINTLRKSQPVVEVQIDFSTETNDPTYTVEVRSRTFPLLVLRAVNKGRPAEDFPFRLTWASA